MKSLGRANSGVLEALEALNDADIEPPLPRFSTGDNQVCCAADPRSRNDRAVAHIIRGLSESSSVQGKFTAISGGFLSSVNVTETFDAKDSYHPSVIWLQ
jgi:hypothetical protein